MYESIYKIFKLENEVSSDLSFFWYSDVDKHLFHMPAEQRITQTLDRKLQWIECVTVAYEAWAALSDSQITSQQQLAPLWNQSSGQ